MQELAGTKRHIHVTDDGYGELRFLAHRPNTMANSSTSLASAARAPLLRSEPLPISDAHNVGESNTAQSPSAEDTSLLLTPLRAHYLKKSLFQLQLRHELEALTASYPSNISALSYLGKPFTPPPKGAPLIDIPFLKYVFRQFVLTFPFMAAAPKDFYSEKLQPFMAAVLSRNPTPSTLFDDDGDATAEDEGDTTRKKIITKLERNFSVFLGNATKLVEKEDVVRLSQRDLDRLEVLARKRQARLTRSMAVFEVNVVGVRTVTDKGRMRSRVHDVRELSEFH
jgi:hypothetical protein